MTKIENVINLAKKLNTPIKVINSNTVLIKRHVFQILTLAKKLHIQVIIECEKTKQKVQNLTVTVESQVPQVETSKYKCFFCGKVVDVKSDNVGNSSRYNFFHLTCERRHRLN